MKVPSWLAVAVLALLAVSCGGDGDNKTGILQRDTSAPTAIALTPALSGTRVIQTLQAGPTAGPRPTTAPTQSSAAREPWQVAMLDSSAALPGQYIPPHPGADGRVCDVRSCVNSMDDRNHVSGAVPICTTSQRTAGNLTNPLCYNSDPPASGPHANTFAQNRVYEEPVPKEQLVHAMEHSAVIIWYNTTDQNVIRTLAQITNGANQSRKPVVMSPYPGMEPNTIALTAWTRLDKFPVSQFRDQRVLDFINAHAKRFNPEGF
jgi:hypothetical protein